MKVVLQVPIELEEEDLKALERQYGAHWPNNRYPRDELIKLMKMIVGCELSRLRIGHASR